MNQQPVSPSNRRLGRRHFVQLTGLGLGSAAILNACGGGSSSPATTTGAAGSPSAKTSDVVLGGNMQYGLAQDITSLDPHLGVTGQDYTVFTGLYERSLTYSDAGELVPGLAEKFEYPDNTTIIVTYRSGVTFHDGTPFTADAVKQNFDRYLDPATGTSGGVSLKAAVAKYEVVNSNQVKFTLSAPNATVLASIGGIMIVSPAAMQKFGKDLARNVVGTGAFKLKEWLPDDHVGMERFENFWNGKSAPGRVPRLDSVTFKPIVEPSVMLANLKSGTIHITDAVQPVDFGPLQSASGIVAVQQKPASSVRMLVNVHKAPTDDLRVRQAISLAIDRDALGKIIYFGLGQPANSIFPPTTWIYPKDRPLPKRDIPGAKAKLSEAGASNPSLDLILPASEPYQSIAQVIQASLAEAGMKVNIKQNEQAQELEDLKAHAGNLALSAIGDRADPDGYFNGNLETNSPFNFSDFADAPMDKLLADALLLTSDDERKPLYLQAEQRLIDEVPIVFLYNPPGLYAQLASVQQFDVNPLIGAQYDTTWLKKS